MDLIDSQVIIKDINLLLQGMAIVRLQSMPRIQMPLYSSGPILAHQYSLWKYRKLQFLQILQNKLDQALLLQLSLYIRERLMQLLEAIVQQLLYQVLRQIGIVIVLWLVYQILSLDLGLLLRLTLLVISLQQRVLVIK